MPSLASKSRPALKNIGNDDLTKLKAGKKAAIAPTTTSAPTIDTTTLPTVLAPAVFPGGLAHDLLAKDVAPVLEDALPMEVDQVVLPAGVEDIDEEDAENPLMAAEYVNDIYAYLRDVEVCV